MLDYIIANGTIYDGTGQSGYQGDIGIKDGVIDAIGDLGQHSALEQIDASGLVVSPGFIDMHTHSDFTLLVNASAESQIHQGVTLETIGQCGHSCAPVVDPDTVSKSILGYHPGVDIQWKSFGQYLAQLEKKPLGVNVAALVGHGAIYRAVKGEDSTPVTASELLEMEKVLASALEEGAFGLSTGLEYWPGSISQPQDIAELCKVVNHYDALYATHVRNRDLYYDLAFAEALAMARFSGARLQISHIQPKFGAPPEAMAHTLEMINCARKYGVDVGYDIIPDEWSFTTMTSILPAWAFEGGIQVLLDRLADPTEREKLKVNPQPIWQLVKEKKWEKIALFRADHNPDLIGMTFDNIGRKLNMDPHDAALEILFQEGDNIYNATWTSQGFSEADLLLCLDQATCGVISDGMALAPYGILKNTSWSPSNYNWTARLFEYYVRKKGALSLPEAVRRITELPAQRLRLKNRGVLKPGYAADVTVFDLEKVANNSTLKNPNVYPEGFMHVFVNGALELKNGVRTKANAGHVIRRNS